MQLSIIIVNFNVKYFLEQCLCAAQKACTNIRAEILVLDNDSTDGSLSYLIPRFPTVQFIPNKKNLGFGAACNEGLARASGQYFLFLNPDTLVPEDCFEKSLEFMQAHPHCGALGVRMLDGSGNFLRESKRMLPDLKTSFFKMLGTANLFPSSKTFARYYAGHLPEQQNNEVDILAGAYMMLNTKAAAGTGGFDTDFFMYGEDVDLSYRIQKSGMKNYYFAASTIVHFKGESTQRKSKNYIKHFYGAMQLFVSKHFAKQKTSGLIHLAISATRIFATMKLFFGKNQVLPINVTKPEHIVTIGTVDDLEALNRFDLTAGERLTVSSDTTAETIIEQINSINVSQERVLLLFVSGGLSNKTIITVMDRCKGNYRYLFHHKGSDSIVGSDKRDSNGRFIVAL